MRSIRSIKERIASNKVISRLKKVKNIEIVIAVILALIAAIAYFAIGAKSSESASTNANVAMSEGEARLAELISEIAGVGKSRVLITTGSEKEVVGVVVVAEGVTDMSNRVKVIRCVEKATGATVDQIEIFEMENGG